MKKRILAGIFALVIIVGFVAACSGNAPPAATPVPATETPAASTQEPPTPAPQAAGATARGVYITMDLSSVSQRFDYHEFQRLMGDYNIELTINTGGDISAIEQAIAEGLDVIFINPADIEAIIPALTRAREAGIIVCLFLSHPPLDEYPDYPFDFFVGSDDYLGAKQAGEFISEQFPDGANFVEIGGQEGHIFAIERYNGFRDGIEGNIVELDSQFVPGTWQTHEAREIMEDFLLIYGDEINIVYCHWDNGASGVIEAVQCAERIPGTDIAAGEVFIIGFDGNETGYYQVEAGVQALSVGFSFTNIVIKSLELARMMLDGGIVEKINWVPFDMVTLETIDSFPWPYW